MHSRPITVIGVILFMIVWGRLVTQAFANPSPAKIFEDVVDGENVGYGSFACSNHNILEDDTIWKVCFSRDADSPVFVRFDFTTGEAIAEHELPGFTPGGNPAGYARNGDNELLLQRIAVAGSQPNPESPENALVVILGSGETRMLWPFDNSVNVWDIVGVDWVGEDIEVIYRLDDGNAKYHYNVANDTWETPQDISAPPDCECTLQAARYADDGWHFLFFNRANDTAVWADEVGDVTPTDMVVTAFTAFDPAIGNVMPGGSFLDEDVMYRFAEENWIPLEVDFYSQRPANSLRLTGTDFVLENERLELLPQVIQLHQAFNGSTLVPLPDLEFDLMQWFYVNERWVEVIEDDGEIAVREYGSSDFAALDVNFARMWNQFSLFPSVDDGYWLISNQNEYVHLNADFERDDTLLFHQRILRVVNNFSFYETFPITTNLPAVYDKVDLLKQILYVLLLFAFPTMLLISLLRSRNISDALRNAALVYIPIFIVGIYWFWQMTESF